MTELLRKRRSTITSVQAFMGEYSGIKAELDMAVNESREDAESSKTTHGQALDKLKQLQAKKKGIRGSLEKLLEMTKSDQAAEKVRAKLIELDDIWEPELRSRENNKDWANKEFDQIKKTRDDLEAKKNEAEKRVNLCDGMINYAEKVMKDLDEAFKKLSGWTWIPGTAASCRSQLTSSKPTTQTQTTTSGPVTPPTSPPTTPPTTLPGPKKLTALAVDCPKQAAVGDTIQCTAVGIYEGGSPMEVTNQVTWTPYTSRFTVLRKPESGFISVAYSYMGFSGTVSVRVVDKTGSGAPAAAPQPPPPPPGPNKLVGFVWDCYPQQQVRVGGSVQCKAWGMFEGESDLRDVTGQATWTPGANFTAPSVKPESGFITITVIYWGEMGTKHIRIVDQTGYDPNQDPGLPGKSKPVDPTIQGLITGFATGLTQGTRPPGPKDPQAPIPQPTDYTKPPGYLSSTTTTTMTTVPPGVTTIPTTTTVPPGGTTTVTPPTGGTNISGPTKPQQPPTGGENKGPFCDQYARTAVNQNQQNVAQKCGYSGIRWHSNHTTHYQWCMKEARQGEPEKETSIRTEDLKKCGQKSPTQPGPKPPTTTKPQQPPQGKNNCVDCLVGCSASFPGTVAANNLPYANCRKGCTVGACFQQCQNNCTRNYSTNPDQNSKCLKQCDSQKNDDVKKIDVLIKQAGGK